MVPAFLTILTPIAFAEDVWIEAHKKYNQALIDSPNLGPDSKLALQKKYLEPRYQEIKNSLSDDPSTRAARLKYPELVKSITPPSKKNLNAGPNLKTGGEKPSNQKNYVPSQNKNRISAVGNQPSGSAAPIAPPPPSEGIGTMTEFGKQKKVAPPQKDVKFKVDEHQAPAEIPNPALK